MPGYRQQQASGKDEVQLLLTQQGKLSWEQQKGRGSWAGWQAHSKQAQRPGLSCDTQPGPFPVRCKRVLACHE